MTGEEVELRAAQGTDARYVWRLRSDPRVYELSGSPKPVEWEVHERWFSAALGSAQRDIFVAETVQGPVGVVRFDRNPNDGASVEVSIMVDPDLHGRGIGGKSLLAATQEAHNLGVETLRARVSTANERSIRLFEGAGYVRTGEPTDGWLQFEYSLTSD